MLSHFISQDLSKRLINLSHHQKQKCISLSTTAITAQALNSIKEPWEANLSAPDNEHNRSLLGIRDPSWFTGSGKSNKGLSNIGNNAIDKTKGKVLKSLPQPNLNAVSAREAIDYFENSWNLTETLFSGLQGEEAFYRPPGHRLRHPMIFYYGHPACFYINKLLVSGLVKKPLDARLEGLFEVGVDEMSWDDLNKYETIWPKVKEVTAYRKGVYNTVMEVIHNNMVKKAGGDMNAKHKVTMKDPLWSLFMACEHDRIHIETSSVLIRELPLKLTIPPENFPLPHPSFFNTGSSLLPREGVDYPKNDMIKVKGGSVELGKPIDFPSFGWDNEYGTRKNDVPDFEASKLLVSNGEFYEFVVEGGYREERFWSQEGWRWRRFRNAKWPAFWVQDGPQGSHRYKLRSIFHVSEKMPWSFPVIVNLHEARAFINWKAEKENKPGLRLLTEVEQMLMRDEEYRHQQLAENWRSTGNINDPSFMMSGDDMVKDNRYNLNLAHGSENPVDEHKPNKLGFQDVNGNVWQWLEDDANPYSGFKPHPFYDDFSSPCFDAQHKMIMGGSFISTGDAGANLHSRYHFRPHFLQHSGFRYVNPLRKETFYAEGVARYLKPEEARGGQVAQTPEKPIQQKQQATVVVSKEQAIEESKRNQETYETRALTQQYLALHYGQFESVRNYVVHPGCGVPEKALMFPQRCATQIVEAAKQVNAPIGKNTRALDLGCAVGGSSFELAKTYLGGVVGIDLSKSFIDAAENVRKTGECNFSVPVEGKLESSPINVQIAKEMNLSSQDMERVTFLVGDACNVLATQGLPNPSKGYDAVFMGNLLCRLPSPRKCLDQMPTLVNPGGLLVLASPYSWLEQFTPESEWFGGKSKPKAGESVSSFDNLRKYIEENLEGGFVFVKDADQPLVIREHRRKYQFILSHFAVFQRTKGKQ